MPGAVYIEGDGLTLNTIEADDRRFLRDVINHPAVRAGLLYRPPMTLVAEREFFDDTPTTRSTSSSAWTKRRRAPSRSNRSTT